jgi:hypothetical protein
MFFIITFADNNPSEIWEFESEDVALDALAKNQLTPVDDISMATNDTDCIVIEGEKKVFGLRAA